MNARIYDSEIGRFLSADTVIQDPLDSQAYNRYSYVRNNPLKYTDPTGHWWGSRLWKKIKKQAKRFHRFVKRNIKTIIVVAAVVVVSLVTAGAGAALATSMGATGTTASVVAGATTGAIAGATAGGVGTAVNGGNLKDILRNTLKGAAAGGIGGAVGGYFGNTFSLGRVGAQATANGLGSEIMGGHFRDGFKMGAITAGAQSLYKYISAKYNPSGKPHMLQEGKNDVGKQLSDKDLQKVQNGTMPAPLASDQSNFMQTVGKGPFMDAFGEFHDGFHDLPYVPGDQVSLVLTMPPSYALTVTAAINPYVDTYIIEQNTRRR